jgi:hypothetical protein
MKASKSFNKGMKVKRYADGEYVQDDEPQFKVTPAMMAKSEASLSAGLEKESGSENKAEDKPEFKSFKEAYAWNKKNNGQGSTFDWQGKKIKVQDAVTPKEVKPAKSTVDSGMASRAVTMAKKSDMPISENRKSDYEEAEKMLKNQPAGTSQAATDALMKLRDRAKATYEKAAASEKAGTSMVRLKSGGMVNSYKAKSHGKC